MSADISLEEALRHIDAECPLLTPATVPLDRSGGSVLARDIFCRTQLPRFTASAVDGYGVRSADLHGVPAVLPLQGSIRAGDPATVPLRAGHTLKILTGAPVPAGVDAVVMQERTVQHDHGVEFLRAPKEGENIRRAGEEFPRGALLLAAGTRLTPAAVGLLATAGRPRIPVRTMPRVSVLVTGSELRRPGARLPAGCIPDSNSYALRAALAGLGVREMTVRTIRDDARTIRSALVRALETSHLVLTVGGVSVGERDLVRRVLGDLGVRQVFWQVAIKPGKPVYFGRKGRVTIFGLPGNPVSALLAFHLFVRRGIMVLTGATDWSAPRLGATLTTDLRKKAGRKEFVRGLLEAGRDGGLIATPVAGQDSHMLGGLAASNCLIHFPLESTALAGGTRVDVELLPWGST